MSFILPGGVVAPNYSTRFVSLGFICFMRGVGNFSHPAFALALLSDPVSRDLITDPKKSLLHFLNDSTKCAPYNFYLAFIPRISNRGWAMVGKSG